MAPREEYDRGMEGMHRLPHAENEAQQAATERFEAKRRIQLAVLNALRERAFADHPEEPRSDVARSVAAEWVATKAADFDDFFAKLWEDRHVHPLPDPSDSETIETLARRFGGGSPSSDTLH